MHNLSQTLTNSWKTSDKKTKQQMSIGPFAQFNPHPLFSQSYLNKLTKNRNIRQSSEDKPKVTTKRPNVSTSSSLKYLRSQRHLL